MIAPQLVASRFPRENSRGVRYQFFLLGDRVALVGYGSRNAKLDRFTEAGGNEVGFRALAQQFQLSWRDVLDPTAQDDGCLR